MAEEKLKIEFIRIDNVLITKVLEQPESLRDEKSILYDKAAIEIRTNVSPDLRLGVLHIRGTDRENDNKVAAWCYESIEQAKKYMAMFIEGVFHINDTLPKKERTPSSLLISDVYITGE